MIVFFFLFLFLSFFSFSFFYFFHQKDGVTPLSIAAENGDEQIAQILLEKGKPNVDLPDKVLLLIVSFSFSFSVSHFSIFFNGKCGETPLYVAAQNGHEQIVQLLLEKGKPNVDLATKVLLLIVSFSFSFSVSHFSIF